MWTKRATFSLPPFKSRIREGNSLIEPLKTSDELILK
jgi:hypothetical protein